MAGGLVLGAHARVVAVITTIGDAILRQTTTFRGQAVALPQQVLQSLVVLVLQFRKLAAIGHRRGHSDGDGSVVRTECRGVGGSVNRGHDRHAHGVGISLEIEDGLVSVGGVQNDEVRQHRGSSIGA